MSFSLSVLSRFPFLNAALSQELNVDGSATPVDFYVQAETGFRFVIIQINILLITNGKPSSPTGFLDGAVLTNGIPFITRINGGPIVVSDPTFNNRDLFSRFGENFMEFDNPKHIMIAKTQFPYGKFVIEPTRLELFGIRIRDNLTTVNSARINLIGFRETII